MYYIKLFLAENTPVLKTIRTLLQALFAWGVVALTQLLAGTVLPVDVQAACIAVLTALFAAIMSFIGKRVKASLDAIVERQEGTD
jgi:hypothetical protein